MNGKRIVSVASLLVVLAVVSGAAISAPDKYTLRVPDGLAFSDFKGYEDWQARFPAPRPTTGFKVILGI